MEVKFLDLKQGDITVTQYTAKFNELARFAPHQVDTEERKIRQFEQGLKPWLYSKISVFQIDSFGILLEKAIIAEGGSETLSQYNKEKKNKKSGRDNRGGSSGEGSNSNKRKWDSGSNNNNNSLMGSK